MLKKFLSCTLVLFAVLLAFSSCKKDSSNKNDVGDTGSDDVSKPSYVAVVYSQGSDDSDIAEEIWANVLYSYEELALFNTDAEKVSDREIVVGNTSRKISEKANALLAAEKEKADEDYPMFLIYSDGNSLALVFDDNVEAKKMILEYTLNNKIAENIYDHSSGVIYSNNIVDYQEAKDRVSVENAWNNVEAKLGSEITAELKSLYSLYTDDLIDWFANLYDPAVCVCAGECKNTEYCGGGGYYYSASGRDTMGYLPDIESTNQALGWISSSGMTDGYHYNTVIPEWMEEQIVRFVKSRQDENGYFYHPQWSKESVDNNISRRSRDLSWALSILEGFGASPTYDINGVKGDGLRYDGTPVSSVSAASLVRLTERLAVSEAHAVSKVLLMSDALPSYLVDADGMREYLSGLDITERSYHLGNELAAVAGEITYRDAQLKAEGKEILAPVLINWLNANQNPENGLWSSKSDYYAVNGFFKITFVYNELKYPIPNIEKGLSASIDAIMSDDNPSAVTDIYNTWYNVLNVVENIENCHTEENESVEIAIEVLYSKAPDAIKKTREKLALFAKVDGSFSYNQNTTSATSQGMPVAIPGTNEGDINATVIATTGTANRILRVLGISDEELIPMFTRSDWLRYLHLLEDLEPVIKDEETAAEKIAFTNDTIGALPDDVECDGGIANAGGYPANGGYEVIYDPDTSGKRGKVLKIESVKGIYNAIKISDTGSALRAQCYSFSADMCIPSSDGEYAIRLRMDDCYALVFKMYGGMVNLWDVSTTGSVIEQTDLGIAIEFGEWFNLKVEYYPGDHGTVRIKIYINGTLMAVSDNYYDQYGKKITEGKGTPSSTLSYVSLSTMTALNTTILIDNILCSKSSKPYEAYADVTRPLTVNVDAPDPGEKIYGFEESVGTDQFPDGFAVSGSGVSIGGDADKHLLISGIGSDTSVEIFANNRVYAANCFVFEADINPTVLSSGSKLRIEFVGRKDDSLKLAIFDLVAIEVGGEKYLAIADAHEGKTSTQLHTLLIPCNTESRLKIEHYDDENITLIYLNGKAVTASSVAVKGSQKPGFGILRISSIGSESTKLTLDNIKVECIAKELNVETYNNERIFDFDSSSYGEVTLDGALVMGGVDKYVALNATAGSVKFPVTVRSPLISLTRFESKMTFENNGEYVISMNGKDGKTIASLYLIQNGGTLSLYELTESGRASVSLATVKTSAPFNIALEWYRNDQLLAVSVNGKLLALTSLYYSQNTVSEWVESCIVSAVSGDGKILIDNVKLESKNGTFTLPDDFSADNTENNAEKITFETTGSVAMLPSALTYSLGSSGASFRIEQMLRDGQMERVISMTSNVGGNDAVRVGLTKRVTGANCVSFECDMYIDYADSASWRNMQFWLETSDGKSKAYMFEIWDSTYFSENGGSSSVAAGFTGVRTWFTLKVEYYDGGYVIVYVNGAPIYTGDGYRGKADGSSPLPASNIERINMYPYMDFAVTYKLDNISFIQMVKSYEAPEIKEEEENTTGKVEDVLTFEDGLVNEATEFASGSVNGTTLEVEEEESGNHILVLKTPASSAQNNIVNVSFTKEALSGANGLAFEIDLNIKYTKSDDYLYIQLRDASNNSAAFISIQNDSIIVYSVNSSYQFADIKLKSGQMSRVRVEYGDTNDGVFLRILVGSAVAYENAAYLSRDGKAISSANIAKVELSTWRQLTARMDNITLGRVTLTLPEVKEPDPDEVIPPSYDFEDGELPSSMTVVTNNTNLEIKEDEEHGKYLEFTTPKDSYGTGFIVPVLVDEAGANCVVFEADMSHDVLSGAGLRFNMQTAAESNDMWFEIQKKDGYLYFWLYTASNCYAVSSEPIALNGNDNWFNLKVEYYEGDRDSVRTKVYVDGELIMVTDMFMKNKSCGCSAHGASQTPESASEIVRIRIRNEYGAFSGTLHIDNIKFERIVKECADDAITASRK